MPDWSPFKLLPHVELENCRVAVCYQKLLVYINSTQWSRCLSGDLVTKTILTSCLVLLIHCKQNGVGRGKFWRFMIKALAFMRNFHPPEYFPVTESWKKMCQNSERFCRDFGANVIISRRRDHHKPAAAVVDLDGTFESASVCVAFIDFQRTAFSSSCSWHHIWTSILPLWFFCSDFRAGKELANLYLWDVMGWGECDGVWGREEREMWDASWETRLDELWAI